MSQPFQITKLNQFNILRDDIIAGGTKRRGLEILLKDVSSVKISYAGTTMGHGALALAHACQNAGKIAEIFLCGQEDDIIVQKIKQTNAIVHLEAPMPIDRLYALAKQECTGVIFSPGFNMPEFEKAAVIAFKNLDVVPYSEIWTCSVTGTLTRALKTAFPDKIFRTVSVVKSGPGDFMAPEKYHQVAKAPPTYPSCPYTDAKVWQFAETHGKDDALIWNTAG